MHEEGDGRVKLRMNAVSFLGHLIHKPVPGFVNPLNSLRLSCLCRLAGPKPDPSPQLKSERVHDIQGDDPNKCSGHSRLHHEWQVTFRSQVTFRLGSQAAELAAANF